jgi:hypothetical protein
MKLRPVLLVLLILGSFYYLTTRWLPSGALADLLHHGDTGSMTQTYHGPLGSFSLTEADAAPAFDAEEQQNIAVYKKALPSVVNITSTSIACCDFFRRRARARASSSIRRATSSPTTT